ncbi:hypothetical protein Lser_V15G08137 [Lactuca serriola]
MFTSSIAPPPLILSTLPHRLPPPHRLREVVFGSGSDGRRFHTLHHRCSFQVSGPFRPKVGDCPKPTSQLYSSFVPPTATQQSPPTGASNPPVTTIVDPEMLGFAQGFRKEDESHHLIENHLPNCYEICCLYFGNKMRNASH